MQKPRDRKLFLGPRLRMLRRELGLNQTRMAEELGVSPSYLNHLERNQRPLTAQMLLRLADTYDLDMRGFVAGAHDAAAGDLSEIMADDLVRDLGVGRQEVLEVAENYPGFAEATKRLYRALVDLRQMPGRIETGLAEGGAASPIAWTRAWLEACDNHLAELDMAAERLSAELGGDAETIAAAVRARLAERHGIGVRVVPQDRLAAVSRHYDFHRRRLLLSERLAPASRGFGAAVLLAQIECAAVIAAAVDAAAAPDGETAALVRQIATNYTAAAVMMPYARFHAAAEECGYDLDLLAARFGVSVEQAAHRATTLARPGARGLPLFLLKLDVTGNVVKRFSGGRAPFARYGGGCPRWRVHEAMPGAGTVVDLAELPDGTRWITWARRVRSYPQRTPALLVMGCDEKDGARTCYAAQAGVATPIGPACHLCERANCVERALPPITRALDAGTMSRPLGRYAFGRT